MRILIIIWLALTSLTHASIPKQEVDAYGRRWDLDQDGMRYMRDGKVELQFDLPSKGECRQLKNKTYARKI